MVPPHREFVRGGGKAVRRKLVWEGEGTDRDVVHRLPTAEKLKRLSVTNAYAMGHHHVFHEEESIAYVDGFRDVYVVPTWTKDPKGAAWSAANDPTAKAQQFCSCFVRAWESARTTTTMRGGSISRGP